MAELNGDIGLSINGGCPNKMPLTLVGPTKGIQHFTNWDKTLTSIDSFKKTRFEDYNPSSLYFNDGRTEILCEFQINDINIIDDIAVVAYDKYCDIERKDVTFSSTQLRQVGVETLLTCNTGGSSGYGYSCSQWTDGKSGFLLNTADISNDLAELFTLETLNYSEPIDPLDSNYDKPYYNNLLIKVVFDGTNDFTSGPNQGITTRTVYFKYMGNLPICDFFDVERDQIDSIEDGEVRGWYLVYDESGGGTPYIGFDISDWRDGSDTVLYTCGGLNTAHTFKYCTAGAYVFPDNDILPSWTRTTQDEFSCGCIPQEPEGSPCTRISYWGYRSIGIDEITFIKLTPVIECGKVDVYNHKSGRISSVSSNLMTSTSHGLQDHDIIKVTGGLSTSGENLINGIKYVKLSSANQFYLYEDEEWLIPTLTGGLRTTTGLVWTCVGNSQENSAQSWKYYKSLFSPTGKNGQSLYIDVTYHYENLTTRRIRIDKVDFDELTNNGAVERLLANIPVSDHLTSYTCFWKDWSADYIRSYNFAKSISTVFMTESGGNKYYVLAVGEPGSSTSVDLFGFNNGRGSYDADTDPLRQMVVPTRFPYGRVHLFKIVVDTNSRISSITNQHTIYMGGLDQISVANPNPTVTPWGNIEDQIETGRSFSYGVGSPFLNYSSHLGGEISPLFDQTAIQQENDDLLTNLGDQDLVDYNTGALIYHWIAPHQLATLTYSNYNETIYDKDPDYDNNGWYIFGWVDQLGKSVSLQMVGSTLIIAATSETKSALSGTNQKKSTAGYVNIFQSTITGTTIGNPALTQQISDTDAHVYTLPALAQRRKAEQTGNTVILKEDRLLYGATRITEADGDKSTTIDDEDPSCIYHYVLDRGTMQYSKVQRIDGRDWATESNNALFSFACRFGDHFRYDNRILVTNGYDAFNEFEIAHSTSQTVDSLLDYLHVYEAGQNNLFSKVQKIAPAINYKDSKYNFDQTISDDWDFVEYGNINYDNDNINSKTWNIDLTNRYDILFNKIILRDYLEYIIFEKSNDSNFDSSVIYNRDLVSSVYPYFMYEEKFNASNSSVLDAVRNNPNTLYNYELDNNATDITGFTDEKIISEVNSNHNMILYYINLPYNQDYYTLEKELNIQISIENTTLVNGVSQGTKVLPRIILFREDPRKTIDDINQEVSSSNAISTFKPVFNHGAYGLYSYYRSETDIVEACDSNKIGKPLAKIFNMSYQFISVGNYIGALTISKEDLNEFLINENLLLSSSNDRTLTSNKNINFNDIAQTSYYNRGNTSRTLIVGITSDSIFQYDPDINCSTYGHYYNLLRTPNTGLYPYSRSNTSHNFTNSFQITSLTATYENKNKELIRPYKAKIHNIATFNYTELKELSIVKDSNLFLMNIIRLGKSQNSSELVYKSQPDGGTFNKSISVFDGQSFTDILGEHRVLENNIIENKNYLSEISIYDLELNSSGNMNSVISSFDLHEPEALSLFIKANPVETENFTLYVKGATTRNSGIPLFIEGNAGINSNQATTLYVGGQGPTGVVLKGTYLFLKGRELASQTSGIPLSITAPPSVSPNARGNALTLYMGSGDPRHALSGLTPLYLQADSSYALNTYSPLFLKGYDATGIDSGDLSLALINTQTSIPAGSTIGGVVSNEELGLFIRATMPVASNATLFLKRKGVVGDELEGHIDLTIKNNQAREEVPLFINCTYKEDGDLTLSIPVVVGVGTGNPPMFIRGYEE